MFPFGERHGLGDIIQVAQKTTSQIHRRGLIRFTLPGVIRLNHIRQAATQCFIDNPLEGVPFHLSRPLQKGGYIVVKC